MTLFQGFVFHFNDNRCLPNIYHTPNPGLSVLPYTLLKSVYTPHIGGR